jgi:hypothetical protein
MPTVLDIIFIAHQFQDCSDELFRHLSHYQTSILAKALRIDPLLSLSSCLACCALNLPGTMTMTILQWLFMGLLQRNKSEGMKMIEQSRNLVERLT